MEDSNIIAVETLCKLYEIPESFISNLEEIQLTEVHIFENGRFVHTTHIPVLEKLIRLHFDLHINLEGLDVIHNLLNQILELQEENLVLRNRISRFE
jgi:hypothetical protein